MKKVIDCEGVFEILTRAPFPTGSGSDEEVESHLSVCHECRRLAEALRPAVGLFHETLSGDVSLPEYDGRLAQTSASVSRRRGSSIQRGPLVAAAIAASLVIGLLQLAPRIGGQLAANRNLQRSVKLDSKEVAQLEALSLPRACWERRTDRRAGRISAMDVSTKPFGSVAEVRYLCCLECHRPGGNGPSEGRFMSTMDLACSVCHSASESAPSNLDISLIRRLSTRAV